MESRGVTTPGPTPADVVSYVGCSTFTGAGEISPALAGVPPPEPERREAKMRPSTEIYMSVETRETFQALKAKTGRSGASLVAEGLSLLVAVMKEKEEKQ